MTRSGALASALVLIAALWVLIAGAWKLADVPAFRDVLEHHAALPKEAVGVASVVVPTAEAGVALVAVVVVLGGHRARAAALLALTFAVLGAYAGYLYFVPPPSPAPCGCGVFVGPTTAWGGLALRNLLVAGGLAVLARWGGTDGRS